MPKTTKIPKIKFEYICRSKLNPSYILCTNGEFEHEDYIGPGTKRSAKVYKNLGSAKKVRNGDIIIETLNVTARKEDVTAASKKALDEDARWMNSMEAMFS